ncbi:hypothetical protein O988_09869 [Pseudogymnoascus sp. VKM F-3808]|nr:hypothetical protein V490_09372 [Pseudogymnoascus sp. VKM F-3557]KFX85866.1 hypothetical protein O988_09869 [Pseudogymnoascus sp. VKM F-3808]KFY48398.1 hypothetical protein V495_01370 [Pseudogymnoascus sp. VKM F-4514 (FW-929)]KFY66203.1 hypothetical protein V497_01045 [Pseudogymnoascus sp. VKM F-4516 (FW-969)]
MTRLSQVGNSSVYEASDQRGEPTESEQNRRDINEMQETGNTSKKAAENLPKTPKQRRDSSHERAEEKNTELLKKDPTLPAKMHNNEPSRGAEIDKELQQEDEEELRKKGGR